MNYNLKEKRKRKECELKETEAEKRMPPRHIHDNELGWIREEKSKTGNAPKMRIE